MLDVSCFAGAAPLVRAGLDLAALLHDAGVTRAYVSPAAGLFRSDPTVNDALPDTEFFRPVPIVDPNWTDVADLLASYRDRGCRAVRIVPASHGYHAADARALKQACGAAGLILVLQMRAADPRNLPPDLNIGEVAVADAAELATAAPEVPMIIAGARAHELRLLLPDAPPPVLADLSMAEEPDVLRRAVATHGAHRLLMGTHAPFLTPAAARHKLAAASLPTPEHNALERENAQRMGL